MNTNEVSIKQVNNGFLVCFDTPLRESPIKIDGLEGLGIAQPVIESVLGSILPQIAGRVGAHGHEHLVFKTVEELVSWIQKYFSETKEAPRGV